MHSHCRRCTGVLNKIITTNQSEKNDGKLSIINNNYRRMSSSKIDLSKVKGYHDGFPKPKYPCLGILLYLTFYSNSNITVLMVCHVDDKSTKYYIKEDDYTKIEELLSDDKSILSTRKVKAKYGNNHWVMYETESEYVHKKLIFTNESVGILYKLDEKIVLFLGELELCEYEWKGKEWKKTYESNIPEFNILCKMGQFSYLNVTYKLKKNDTK